MTTFTITTHNYTGEYNFSTCCPKGAYFEHEDSRSYQTNLLGTFISLVTGYLTTKLISFRGDDDTFDNIPALLEEAEQIMRLAYKAVRYEYYQALIIKACSSINETVKIINELEHLGKWDAKLRCITWLDRDEKLEGQDKASLAIYNETGTEVETYYTL